MKIKKIHIDSFGKLKNFDTNFSDGITSINEENEWGKSTLVAFIKAMFYGLEGDRIRDVAQNERKHFKPWDGGNFGGSIVFEVNGKEYKLTRHFGTKEAEDSFDLYDNKTNLKSSDYSKDIGNELFKINSESFAKTVLIGQKDIITNGEATGDINAKIGNIAGVTDDVNNIDDIIKTFGTKINAISSNRKNSEFSSLTNEITEKEANQRKLPGTEREYESKEKERDAKKAKLADCKEDINKLNDELSASSTYDAQKTKKENYEKLCKDYKTREEAEKEASGKFENRIPDSKDLDDLKNSIDRVKELKTSVSVNELNPAERIVLWEFEKGIEAGIPSDEEIETVKAKIGILSQKEKDFDDLQFSHEEKEDYEKYKEVFEGKESVDTKADVLSARFLDASNKKSALSANEALAVSLKIGANKKTGSSLWLILLILGAISVIPGILCVSMGYKLPGLVISCVGAILAVLGLVLKFAVKPAQKEDPAYENLAKQLEEDKKFIEETENEIKDFLSEYNISYDALTAPNALSDIKTKYLRYIALKKKQDDQRDDVLKQEIAELKNQIVDFISKYDELYKEENNDLVKLEKLKSEISTYNLAIKKQEKHDADSKELGKEKEHIIDLLREIGFSYDEKDLEDSIDSLERSYHDWEHADAEFKTAKTEKEDFEATNDIAIIQSFDGSNKPRTVGDIKTEIAEKNEEYEALSNAISEYNRQIEVLGENLDSLHDEAEALADLKEKKKELLEKAARLTKTKELLEKAKASFVGKYSEPVTESFKKIYESIEGAKSSKYTFDANMNLIIEDEGERREISQYSAGAQDKIGLCLRMALIDAMYEGEKPCIIMDDPFVNLDERRLEGAKKLIAELSKDYQIIYLTCHESRLPK